MSAKHTVTMVLKTLGCRRLQGPLTLFARSSTRPTTTLWLIYAGASIPPEPM